MQVEDFIRVLKSFADKPEDLDVTRGSLLFQVREEVLDAKIRQKAGELVVEENGREWPAAKWIVERVARVPLLADRILSYVEKSENFVTPAANLLDQLDFAKNLTEVATENGSSCAIEVLGRRPAGTSSVLYLTSDAGEGKTTLINYIARLQAGAYRAGESDWILVPIPLGGRAFLRFDDVVIAALVNRLRFQWWYFDAFIELVRLGVVVPAFDGFEEMFVEGPSGEALSALGSLMRSLKSSGSVLIAARKAYFEYQSFKSQATLFDAIGQDSVAFARLSLRRWDRDKFIEYAGLRGLDNPELIYSTVAGRLGAAHPMLTRAVLVRRLLDVASGLTSVTDLAQKLGEKPRDYFFHFVNAIVEREAKEKWLTKTGEVQVPLIEVSEHHDLLAMVALEMWISSTDSLRPDVLDVIADMFGEGADKAPVTTRQIKERLKQHSLLTASGVGQGQFAFDHEDFKKFFLGEALGRLLAKNARQDLHAALGVSVLPAETCDHAILAFKRHGGSYAKAIELVQQLGTSELQSSFVKENAGALITWLLDGVDGKKLVVESLVFPSDALAGKRISNVNFRGCYFQPTSINQALLKDCEFDKCRFERIEVAAGENVGGASLDECEISTLVLQSEDEQLFDPGAILKAIRTYGFVVKDSRAKERDLEKFRIDEEVRTLDRVLRIFLRSTHVTENVLKLRLGQKAGPFIQDVLPKLIRAKILVETQYLGAGSQRRFKLGVPMQKLQDALAQSSGSFAEFIGQFDGR